MTAFPKRENDVIALAQQMVNGYVTHSIDFPSVAVAGLETALEDYRSAKADQDLALSQAKQLTAAKDAMLAELVTVMKDDISKSIIDTRGEEQKLSEIGWGQRSPAVPLAAPGQPDHFMPLAEGEGFILLSWDKPLTGGRATTYNIERRDKTEVGFTAWKLAGTSLNTQINLLEQPRGIEMEYRVIATNTAGVSMPSNTASAVL